MCAASLARERHPRGAGGAMIVPAQAVWVVIVSRPVDFRMDYERLAALAQNELDLDPHLGAVVVFRSKRGDRIKILV
ncbi:MAG: IS66 family insertion sequence element accessory protein TnpB [Parvularcula sp.]|jgi:transposase|nr:IS66 family insertion sequence element accessory protein TnpB [Parvularcula sp.]